MLKNDNTSNEIRHCCVDFDPYCIFKQFNDTFQYFVWSNFLSIRLHCNRKKTVTANKPFNLEHACVQRFLSIFESID